jgi:hypothetical protein
VEKTVVDLRVQEIKVDPEEIVSMEITTVKQV